MVCAYRDFIPAAEYRVAGTRYYRHSSGGVLLPKEVSEKLSANHTVKNKADVDIQIPHVWLCTLYIFAFDQIIVTLYG